MLDNQTKVCTKCGVDKLLTEFTKEKTGKLGRRSKCKPCQAKHLAEQAKTKRETTPKNVVKCCNRCGENKGISEFYKGIGKYGRRNTCSTCLQYAEAEIKLTLTPQQKAKKKETQSAWRLANRDTVNAK